MVTSEARGWEWSGLSPLGAKSWRDMVRPMVLIPGKLARPKGLALVLPGLVRAEVVKWEERARLGFRQGAPLRKKGD
ncbi:hypothetical protein QQP08_005945 [Theobroma cacao]|nr:hypothetical protein QQP08_005945 [Theobroma cacao]